MVKSKVQGRRNYVIYCFSNSATLYGYGVAKNAGILTTFISDIIKYNIRWYEFTYKKDAVRALEELGQQGYKTKWGI